MDAQEFAWWRAFDRVAGLGRTDEVIAAMAAVLANLLRRIAKLSGKPLVGEDFRPIIRAAEPPTQSPDDMLRVAEQFLAAQNQARKP